MSIFHSYILRSEYEGITEKSNNGCRLDTFEPQYWDVTLGEWIDLNRVTSKPN